MKGVVFVVVLALSGCWISNGMPMHLSGVLLSPEDGPGDYPRVLWERINKQTWTMHVRSADRRDKGKPASRVLESMRKSFVLADAPGLLTAIQSPTMRGRPLVIEGRLYKRDRMFVSDSSMPPPTPIRQWACATQSCSLIALHNLLGEVLEHRACCRHGW